MKNPYPDLASEAALRRDWAQSEAMLRRSEGWEAAMAVLTPEVLTQALLDSAPIGMPLTFEQLLPRARRLLDALEKL